jgi:release factor-specific protein-(glutamine-N5) methyltransferase
MIISILLFSVANSFIAFIYVGKSEAARFLIRFGIKIALLPLVAGISYEMLKLLAKSKSRWLLPLKAPGLLLQKITTREPEDKMLEVAICAFKEVEIMDADTEIAEKNFITSCKLSKIYAETREKFIKAGIDESDAQWLVSICAGIKRSELDKDKMLSPAVVKNIYSKAAERLTGKPLWYIIGDTDFYSVKIKVDKRVLIPRPETEQLVEEALKIIKSGHNVLDLCTGSGCIAIAVAKNSDATVTASDISADALALAQENAVLNGVKVNFTESNLFDNLSGKFDIIISNPPYVKKEEISALQTEVKNFEPIIALDGGEDGLDFYRVIAKKAKKVFKQRRYI